MRGGPRGTAGGLNSCAQTLIRSGACEHTRGTLARTGPSRADRGSATAALKTQHVRSLPRAARPRPRVNESLMMNFSRPPLPPLCRCVSGRGGGGPQVGPSGWLRVPLVYGRGPVQPNGQRSARRRCCPPECAFPPFCLSWRDIVRARYLGYFLHILYDRRPKD